MYFVIYYLKTFRTKQYRSNIFFLFFGVHDPNERIIYIVLCTEFKNNQRFVCFSFAIEEMSRFVFNFYFTSAMASICHLSSIIPKRTVNRNYTMSRKINIRAICRQTMRVQPIRFKLF